MWNPRIYLGHPLKDSLYFALGPLSTQSVQIAADRLTELFK